jgi:alpha-glucosidase (family GH31 glycosyl hydrolase)
MYKVYLEGGALVRPLFFDYPTDDKCFEDLEHTYFLGDSIKVSPVLTSGVTDKYKAYFPAGKWVDLNNYTTVIDSTGDYVDLENNLAGTNIHLKSGKIIPFQLNVG